MCGLGVGFEPSLSQGSFCLGGSCFRTVTEDEAGSDLSIYQSVPKIVAKSAAEATPSHLPTTPQPQSWFLMAAFRGHVLLFLNLPTATRLGKSSAQRGRCSKVSYLLSSMPSAPLPFPPHPRNPPFLTASAMEACLTGHGMKCAQQGVL